jgi:hypothetical protein
LSKTSHFSDINAKQPGRSRAAAHREAKNLAANAVMVVVVAMTVVMVLGLGRCYNTHQRDDSDKREQKLLHDDLLNNIRVGAIIQAP